ncbi:hypothetical protein [Devosia sediminis]|uniref:Uncharacterized protein n=1 Tax=Devosia sediminis TaxID=2798801 RepID=A0A934ISL6_9HYPH|nr:hypothetical protein [Devosia sediminis]MBJ3783562.1 hypothetical protein [Devosia sediminis]
MEPDRETVIVDRGSGSGVGMLVGIVLIVALLAIGYLVFFNNDGSTGGTVDVDVPAVSVDVVPDGQ